MNLEAVKLLVDYNYTLHRSLWDSMMTLTDEQFIQPVPYSIGSVRNHLVHLMNVDSRWIARVKGDELPDHMSYAAFPTREATHRQWDRVEKYVLNAVTALQVDDLERLIPIRLSSRPDQQAKPVWQILVHLVNHGTDHRAQLLRVLHDLGTYTFDQDLMYYLWDHPAEET